jgi:hypothetical protein
MIDFKGHYILNRRLWSLLDSANAFLLVIFRSRLLNLNISIAIYNHLEGVQYEKEEI